jgi:hypothetical protein
VEAPRGVGLNYHNTLEATRCTHAEKWGSRVLCRQLVNEASSAVGMMLQYG